MNNCNFLHNHPHLEKSLGLEPDLVIVDREDWEKSRIQIPTGSDNRTDFRAQIQEHLVNCLKQPIAYIGKY
jgi:hypothetical protein